MVAKKVIILGGNDTSYQLQLGLLGRLGMFDVSLVHDSNYIYTPNSFFPDLLVGLSSIRDAVLENNKFFSPKVQYLRQPPAADSHSCFINTVTDAHHISILHLPAGRRRYFTLHNADNVIMAAAELTQYRSLIVHGSTPRAIAYACSAASAGYQTWLVNDGCSLINNYFDGSLNQLIKGLLSHKKIQLISPSEASSLAKKHPALFTPYSDQSTGLMRVRQQLNHRFQHYPNVDLSLQDGGDWYQLPLQATEQLINRIAPESNSTPKHLSFMWSNKPDLPHKVNIDRFNIHYAGELQAATPYNCLTLSIPELNTYRKIILNNNRVAGFVLAGDVRGSDRLADMMLTHQDIQPLRDNLLFCGY